VGRYAFVEGIAIADCAMDVEGESLDDLFATAARAVADVMVAPATVARDVERRVDLAAPSVDLLLYDWLSELIFLKDTEEAVFPGVEVRVTRGEPCRLSARLEGGVIDRERTETRADVKAVTFHQFTVEPSAGGWRARVVLDI